MYTIAVLITCYNRQATTLDCLHTLSRQKGVGVDFSLEVFIVDDASIDGTGNKIREEFGGCKKMIVNVIDGTGSLFWCKGMRLAWDKAVEKENRIGRKYDYFLWVNDDIHLKPDAIFNIINDGRLVNGVVVGTFAFDDTYTCVGYSAKRKDGYEPIPNGLNSIKISNGSMNGNLVLVPHDVYDKIGPIYGGYSHGFGDYDYGMMLIRAGLGFWSSSHWCGWCECETSRVRDMRGATLRERLALLRNPRGRPLRDTFIYRYRHWGLLRALVSSAHVIWMALFSKTAFR